MNSPRIITVLALITCAGALSVLSVRAQQAPAQAPAAPAPTAAVSGGVDPRPPVGLTQVPAFPGQTRAPEKKANVAFDVVTVAEVQNPWGLAFLPDRRMLVTERTGNLRIVSTDGKLSEPVAGVPKVIAQGQGGLLDVAIDPNYARNGLIYLSYSEPRDGDMNNTAVARGKLVDGPAPRLDNVQVIYHQAPSMANAITTLHYGSRLVFRRDGTLFVTQGDRSHETGRTQAQQMDSLLGKIVRINSDGSVPKDNPFVGKEGVRPEIWSIGHRNVQAATIHPTTGELWEVEMGTRGGDELNIAKKGKDYGWPTIAYGMEYAGGPIRGGVTQKEGMEQPRYYWDPVIAPSGMIIYTGNLFPAWKNSVFIGALGGTSLVRLTVDGEKVTGEERLLTDLQPARQRIRNVVQGPDGAIYVLAEAGGGGPGGFGRGRGGRGPGAPGAGAPGAQGAPGAPGAAPAAPAPPPPPAPVGRIIKLVPKK